MNRRLFAVGLFSVIGFALATNAGHAEDSAWIYPQSKLLSKAGPEGENAAWPNESIDVRSTDDTIEKVVAYYVKHSGFEPPNWKILGREFPHQTKLPVGFWIGPGKTKTSAARVTITHHLRSDLAHVTFLVVAEAGEITSISVTRGKNEDQTWIQVHEHSFKNASPQLGQRTKP
ncbi:hypothetical protein [Stieleria mannarensis]|uniref:hypothetical protein n=1 Tax=Stieleria mannarensis TaxID=2755585 RepID=UPI0016036351|nr:hypothetical protein [Rhodopirellula sp. JC639]